MTGGHFRARGGSGGGSGLRISLTGRNVLQRLSKNIRAFLREVKQENNSGCLLPLWPPGQGPAVRWRVAQDKNKSAVVFTSVCLFIVGQCGARGRSSSKANSGVSEFHEVIFLALKT